MSTTQTSAADWTIAVSISESPDLEVLGMFEGDDKRMLSTVLTPLVYRGARVAYGGRIEPAAATNFTQEISAQLAEAYRLSSKQPGSRPFIHYLRDNDARSQGEEKLLAHALKLGSYSEIRLLRGATTAATILPSGSVVDVYVDDAQVGAMRKVQELMTVPRIKEIFSGPTGRDELADMRVAMVNETDARIILGGRVSGVAGGTSGIASEALVTLAMTKPKPLLVLGGIGGASRDVAWMLGLINDAERVERDDSAYLDNKNIPSKDRYWAHMEKLRAFSAPYLSRLEQANVLDHARRLAVSESYAEIGSLVVTMLNRLLPPESAPEGQSGAA